MFYQCSCLNFPSHLCQFYVITNSYLSLQYVDWKLFSLSFNGCGIDIWSISTLFASFYWFRTIRTFLGVKSVRPSIWNPNMVELFEYFCEFTFFLFQYTMIKYPWSFYLLLIILLLGFTKGKLQKVMLNWTPWCPIRSRNNFHPALFFRCWEWSWSRNNTMFTRC